jgi:PKD repeat protein
MYPMHHGEPADDRPQTRSHRLSVGARVVNALRRNSLRLYKLMTIVLTVAMIANYLGHPPAAEAEGYGILEVNLMAPYSYGDKVFASGRLYSIAFCPPGGTGDAVGTASDVWFVKDGRLSIPTPFPVPLGDIGTKVGIISVTYGSTFDLREIGYIANSMYGGDMTTDISGSYKIVLDNCQDGEYNADEDYIHDELLRVHQAGPPDARQIAAASEMKNKWRKDSIVWNAMSKVLTGVIAVAMVVVPILNARNIIGGMATALIGAGGFFLGYVAIYFSDVAKKYEALAADPPDPLYKQYSALPGVQPLVTPTSDPLLESTIALTTAGANEGAAAEMLLHSLERYQGAQLEGRYDWQLVHARALRSQITLLQDQIARSSAAADELSAALAADTRDLDTVFATVEPLRARIASSGLTSAERLALLGMGFSDEQVDRFVEEFAALPFDLSISGIQSQLAELRAAGADQSAELDVWAAQIDQVIADFEADPLTGDPGPVARAGGPYTAQVGAPLTLSATASTSPVAITSYQWDLDGDGAFDDATGATPSVTFSRPGQQLIGLRTVNEYGLANVDFTALAVAPVNHSPRFDSVSAAPEDFNLVIGETWPVNVTVSDPDGDAVEVKWLLDGNVVGSGLSYSYTPGEADIGVHTLQAVATNPGTSATPARHAWSFGVGGRDVDNDSWRSHLDCDDTDPSINPGMSEVLGNGKDDDCNPKTTDTGGPPVVLFNPQGGGRNVALFEAGAAIHSFSSQNNTSNTPQSMIDYGSSDAGWRSASGKNTNQWAIIALAGGKTYQIDRVKLMPGAGNEGAKTFSVAVSTSAAEGPYTTVFTGTAALNGPLQEYVLPEPVKAKYVKLTALTSQNNTSCCVAVKQFKVYTSQEGAREVTFDNLTVDSDNDIVSWAWDFGDGTTSSEKQPTHTYAALSKTYNVSLKVTDRGNNVVTYALPYRVLLPPAASFTVTPASPNEASKGTYTETSTDPDGEGMLATRTWYWTSTSTSTSSTPSTTQTYQDSGNVVVKLQVVDRQEQVATVEKTVTIANVPPSVVPAANQAIVWGQNIDTAAVNVSDVSFADRGALVCDWNFGDSANAHVERCDSLKARVAHAYTNPGSYTATLTVRDPDGGTTSASTLVTVQKRDSFVQVLNVRSVAGGNIEVTAKLFDSYTWATLPGWNVTFSAGTPPQPHRPARTARQL